MKRDMDLIRNILLAIEEKGDPIGTVTFAQEDFPDHEWRNVWGHFRMLDHAGIIEAPNQVLSGQDYSVSAISWHGYEFLDLIRDDEIWRQTKEGAEKVKGFSMEILEDIARGFIKTQVKRLTGVDV